MQNILRRRTSRAVLTPPPRSKAPCPSSAAQDSSGLPRPCSSEQPHSSRNPGSWQQSPTAQHAPEHRLGAAELPNAAPGLAFTKLRAWSTTKLVQHTGPASQDCRHRCKDGRACTATQLSCSAQEARLQPRTRAIPLRFHFCFLSN